MPARRPRFVFVNRFYQPDESATSQLLTDLVRHLSDNGSDVQVICSRQLYDDASARLPKREVLNGVAVRRIWSTRFGRAGLPGRALDYASFYLACACALTMTLRRGDTVVAKTDPPLLSIIAALSARAKRATLVNWLQDLFPEIASALGENPLPRPVAEALQRVRDWSLRAARLNVVLGERMRERLISRGILASRITIIENWPTLGADAPKPPDRSELRLRQGLRDKFIVGYSGNLGRVHDFNTVLGAADLLKGDERVVFLMIGGGAGMNQLKQRVAANGLPNFHFLGYQPRASLADSLAAPDVHWVSLDPALEGLVVPSKFYGILAAARPVVFIGDADGELSRVIGRARCGATVAPGDSSGFAAAIRSLQADGALRIRSGTYGYQFYRQHYTAERALEQWSHALTGAARD